MTERFLDDDSAPTSADGVGETSRGQSLGDDRELARRDGEVERVVARRTSALVELCEHLGQPREPLRVIECSFHKPQTVSKRSENLFVELLARVRGDRFEDEGAKLLVVPVAPAIAHHRESGVEETSGRQVIHGGNELFEGQVSCDSEDDERRGARNAGESSVTVEAKRIRFHRYFAPLLRKVVTACSLSTDTVSTGRPREIKTERSPAAWACIRVAKSNG